jgi:hypothetical protein
MSRRDADDFDSWLAGFSTSTRDLDSENLSVDDADLHESQALTSRQEGATR